MWPLHCQQDCEAALIGKGPEGFWGDRPSDGQTNTFMSVLPIVTFAHQP